MRTIDEWRNTYPGINWDSPIPIHILRPDGVMLRVLACRVCIANEGISAQQVVEDLAGVAAFLELDEFLQHLSEKHG